MMLSASCRRAASLPALRRRALSSAAAATAPAEATKVTAVNTGSGGGGGAIRLPVAAAVAGMSLAMGYAAGYASSSASAEEQKKVRVLPSGLPRSCCSCDSPPDSKSAGAVPAEAEMTPEQKSLPSALSAIVGSSNVMSGLTENSSNAPYLKGARLGRGSALAVVKPQTLGEAVRCLQAVVDAGCVVIPQGANTGLTGGSVPRGEDKDGLVRPRVVMSMRDLDVAFPIDGGERVVALAGVGISDLSQRVSKWFPDRESHSVLGSMFLNPTAAAGVAFGSGGTQLRKGPAYTDRALYAKVHRNKWGENVVTIVNALGIEGIEDDDFPNDSGSVVEQLDAYMKDVRGGYTRAMGNSSQSKYGKAQASDAEYKNRVCEDDSSVSRYNADTRGEDCNRSEGKVLILATVHDTFPKADKSRTFWVSFRDLDTALAFRREVLLDSPHDLPVSAEYMDRDSFDVVDTAGRFSANLIKVAGMGGMIKFLWDVKMRVEGLPFDWAPTIVDKILWWTNGLTPAILPSRMMEAGRNMDHHIAMTVGEFGGGTLDRLVERMDKFVEKSGEEKVKVFECASKGEETSLTAFRFVAATAFRTWCVGNDAQGISVDYALPKNGGRTPALAKQGGERTADDASSAAVPIKRMRYSHFGCNVVHEDVAYGPDVDVHEAKMALKGSVEHGCGGRLPAEHGHGTEYKAPPEAQERWRRMDPLNVLNPGIGGLPSGFKYQD